MIKLSEKIYFLKSETEDLVTRQRGSAIREKLAKIIREMDEKVFCLDLKGIRVIDFSCADEVITKLVARVQSKELGDKFLILANLTNSHRDNIGAALKISGKNILVKDIEKGWDVLGEVKEHVMDVLKILMEEKEITTRELRRRLGDKMEMNTLSNKMAILYDDRLIYRERKPEPEKGGGRQFLYRALF